MIASTVLVAAATAGHVIFRLDDVQDFYKARAARDVVRVFHEEQVPVSIGVIANFFGQDINLVGAVREAVTVHGCDVFNHGPDATTLFDEVDKAEAKRKIAAGEVGEFRPYTAFVPHENRWKQPVVEALEELGYSVVSTSVRGRWPMAVGLDGPVLRLPQAAETAEYMESTDTWVHRVGNVLPHCEAEIAAHGVCVVMMHPQEFDERVVTLEELRALIGAVQAQGWVVKTFTQYAAGGVPPTPPQTPNPVPATPAPVVPVTPAPTASASCTDFAGSACRSCLFDNGVCYEMTEARCKSWTTTTWCGAGGPVPTPAPTVATPEPTTQAPAGGCGSRIPEWGNCLSQQECCAPGLTCVVQSQWWASCRRQ